MQRLLSNNRLLWTLQILLAALYLFAGGFKVFASADAMQPPNGQPQPLPIWFLRMIGAFECLGALGLILPGLTGISRQLTPIAAAALAFIMVGAVVTTIPSMGAGPAVLPFVALLADAAVAYGRWNWLRANRGRAA